jgi:hypothetical protein
MPLQSGKNVSVAYKVQSGLGTPATGASGEQLPLVPSSGLRLSKTPIESPEVRSDGMTTIPRHGSRSVTGELGGVLRVGALDTLFEALFRSTWVASATITQATMTSITTTTNTIVAAAGSWITQGVRVGDVVTLADHSTVANNNKRLAVTNVTASTITVPAGSLTLNASPDTTFSLTRHKRLAMGTTERYFSFDEYHADIDQSEYATDCKIGSVNLSMQADGTVVANFGIVGRDLAARTTGDSPILTSPTAYDTANLVATDAIILKDGVAITTLTGLDLTIDMAPQTQAVVGSVVSPDVFSNNARVTGTISALREDLTWLANFADEDFPSLMLVFKEPEADPYDFHAVYIPYFTLTESPSASLGGDGPMISTMSFAAGKRPVATGFVETMVQMSSSAA